MKEMVSINLEHDEGNQYSLLRCPTCENTYLHQAGIKEVTTIDHNKSGGICIPFMCEYCSPNWKTAHAFLLITQHKGLTMMEWSFEKPINKETEFL